MGGEGWWWRGCLRWWWWRCGGQRCTPECEELCDLFRVGRCVTCVRCVEMLSDRAGRGKPPAFVMGLCVRLAVRIFASQKSLEAGLRQWITPHICPSVESREKIYIETDHWQKGCGLGKPSDARDQTPTTVGVVRMRSIIDIRTKVVLVGDARRCDAESSQSSMCIEHKMKVSARRDQSEARLGDHRLADHISTNSHLHPTAQYDSLHCARQIPRQKLMNSLRKALLAGDTCPRRFSVLRGGGGRFFGTSRRCLPKSEKFSLAFRLQVVIRDLYMPIATRNGR